MWTDEHVSSQLLATHLSQHTDLASRKETTIRKTVDWILSKSSGEKLDILDLGCGPGLYTEKLAENGHEVTGMDFSANSIRHARKSADDKHLNINYIIQDYLQLEADNRYDVILLIFMDFCVLNPNQHRLLLKNTHRALKPGGKFIFDVLNHGAFNRQMPVGTWEATASGFWKNEPYVALSTAFDYGAEKVRLSQHIIIDSDDDIDVYRFWHSHYSHDDLDAILTENGFHSMEYSEEVIPGCELYDSRDVTFVIGTKK
ncbi:MAG: class I SAM-dependent methyltransferase [Desulfobacteraceae bacterium]|nr:class I SAM-dependent methyltransferase [Desulfobacteraceae bacterium]